MQVEGDFNVFNFFLMEHRAQGNVQSISITTVLHGVKQTCKI